MACRDDCLWLLGAHRCDRKRSFEPAQRPHQRLAQGLAGRHPLGQKVCDHLCIRLRAKTAAAPLELLSELRMVLDDAVVDYCDLRTRITAPRVRMGVGLAGTPVRRPACVAHPSPHLEEVAVPLPHGTSQVVEGTYLLGRLDPSCIG